MRKISIVAAVVAALVTAGIAVAHGIGAKSAKAVTGTFMATSASNVETKTCTTSDGKTIAVSHGTYSGTALGDADLAGPITLGVHSVINTTDNVGIVEGRLKIDVASGDDTTAGFATVYANGSLAGLASGRAHEPGVGLVGNISAGFSTAGGFTGGKIGGGTAGGAALELGPARCAKQVRETSEARGTVSAVSQGSITVGGLTCAVPASLAAKVGQLKVGDRARIRCELVSGANTLKSVEKRG